MFSSSVYVKNFIGESKLWRSSCKAFTSWERLVLLDLGEASKQVKIFINFSKEKSSLIIMELAM